MIEFLLQYQNKLVGAMLEHMLLVGWSLFFSILLTMLLLLVSLYSKKVESFFIYLFSIVYSIPSLALFAILIPLSGLGKTTAILGLVLYSQYILLSNIMEGIHLVDSSIIDSATGMGMTKLQIFWNIQLPLSKKSIFAAVRLSIVSTISIATIAAAINAGGLGTILFDGLRTMNTYKIISGTILTILLSLGLSLILTRMELRLTKNVNHKHKGRAI